MIVTLNLFLISKLYFLQILFRAVVAHQCLGSIWGRRDRPSKNSSGKSSSRGGEAASVTATVEQFNAVSFRVQSTILLNTDLRPADRAKLIQRWIDISQVRPHYMHEVTV